MEREREEEAEIDGWEGRDDWRKHWDVQNKGHNNFNCQNIVDMGAFKTGTITLTGGTDG